MIILFTLFHLLHVVNSRIEHLPKGKFAKKVTLINRSDQVGKPLAALLARGGYFVDAFGLKEMESWAFTNERFHRALEPLSSTINYAQSIRTSGSVITGVPDEAFTLSLETLPNDANIIDFALPSHNIDEAALEKMTKWSGSLVQRMGRITSLMLMQNLVKVCGDAQ